MGIRRYGHRLIQIGRACLVLAIACAACNAAPLPSPTPSQPASPTASPSPTPTPDTTAPLVLRQDPAPGAIVDTSGRIEVTFSEPVSAVDGTSFQLSDEAGTVVDAGVTLDPGGRVATLTPADGLTVAVEYRVTLTGAIRDGAGNRLVPATWDLSATHSVSFATGTYTGYQFGPTTADLVAIKRAGMARSSSASTSEYRVMDGAGYLIIDNGVWAGYWVHGTPAGVALDDLAAPLPPLPTCNYVDLPTARPAYGDWATTLLDTVFMLPSGYAPPDLVDTSQAGLNGSYFIRSIAVSDLKAMVDAAAADGARLAVQSAYRSYIGQVLTFNGWVRQVGYGEALKTSARPGHSEHQLGTAIDFRSVGGGSPWNYPDWAKTTEGAWLAANAWTFGWVMSYPSGTSAVSCYRYEPWHYRYVGRATAAAVHNAGGTLRAWLWAQGYGVR
jgi:D-alanyl-D-alanine carboxypeptidase